MMSTEKTIGVFALLHSLRGSFHLFLHNYFAIDNILNVFILQTYCVFSDMVMSICSPAEDSMQLLSGSSVDSNEVSWRQN